MDASRQGRAGAEAPSREAPRGRWRRLAIWALAALGALAPAAAGGVLVAKASSERVVREARAGDLLLHLDRAGWIHDDMEHSDKFPMPDTMMPGMPRQGFQRLYVEVTARNVGRVPRTFSAHEMELHAPAGGVWPATGGEVGDVRLDPGHALTTTLYFDVPETEPGLRLVWDHNGAGIGMLVTKPPVHEEKEPAEKVDAWPEDVSALPPGNPERGRQLFTGALSCVSCHGQPGAPGSNTVGPDLGNIAEVASARVKGQGAAQYLYESLLYPNASISPVCAGGAPCAKPSQMPFYGELLSLQKMADVIAYLMVQREGNPLSTVQSVSPRTR